MAFCSSASRLSHLLAGPSCELCALRRVLPPLSALHSPRRSGSGPRRFKDEKSARKWAGGFVGRLDARERQFLREAMRSYDGEDGVSETSVFHSLFAEKQSSSQAPSTEVAPLNKLQIRQVFFYNAFPFIGFGFLDNGIMIVAGEYIDLTFGSVLAISTMAAAALGNLVSDVCGIGLAGYVEMMSTRFGVSPPNITAAQHERPEARWASSLARAIGVAIGCVLGMFPLLIFKDDKKEEEEEAAEPPQVTADPSAKKT